MRSLSHATIDTAQVRATVAVRGVLAAVFALTAIGLCAADTRTQLLVTATVQPTARFTRLLVPQSLEVTADDAARGFIDVPEPTRLSVSSNSNGFVLDVHSVVPMLAGMNVYGLGGAVTLVGEGGSIVERSRPAGTSDLDLTFRLVLARGTPPGRYPWPLQLGVRPLRTP